MSQKPLENVPWQWEECDDGEGYKRVWYGKLRIVSAKRARKLKKRGVHIEFDVLPSGRKQRYWFVK